MNKHDRNCLPAYLVEGGAFHFARLALKDIDNRPVLNVNAPAMAGEETCLFHRDVPSGDDYLARLNDALTRGVAEHRELPVVRFADGEYAFYGRTLGCNGLYEQAESADAIKRALPSHIAALEHLSMTGILAPLIFPGNAGRKKRLFFPRRRNEPSAATFLNFLQEEGITLTARNYLPFYVVYAYLASADFARLMDGRKLCILNSEYNAAGCRRWFDRFSSRPEIVFCAVPAAYMATRWESFREDILKQVPTDADCCLVGAGVGALTVCVDVARRFSLPAVDAGHILNMMNEREDKSRGPRLYTLRRG